MDQRLRSWVTGESDKRDAINDVSYLWPKSDDGTVRVPYTLSDEIQRGKKSFQQQRITCFIDLVEMLSLNFPSNALTRSFCVNCHHLLQNYIRRTLEGGIPYPMSYLIVVLHAVATFFNSLSGAQLSVNKKTIDFEKVSQQELKEQTCKIFSRIP